MSIATANRIRKFIRAVRQLEPECSVQKLQVLMEVMLQPGIEQQSLLQKTGQTRSAVSKNLADWSDITTRKQPGPGLIESRIDPTNRVIRTIWPTEKGKKEWEKLLEAAQ